MLAGATDVDPSIYHKATVELGRKDANIVHSVATLSTIDQSLKCRFEGTSNETCIFCKECKSSVVHVLWYCKHPELLRARCAYTDPKQKYLVEQAHALPNHLLLGITPSLSLDPMTPW